MEYPNNRKADYLDIHLERVHDCKKMNGEFANSLTKTLAKIMLPDPPREETPESVCRGYLRFLIAYLVHQKEPPTTKRLRELLKEPQAVLKKKLRGCARSKNPILVNGYLQYLATDAKEVLTILANTETLTKDFD